MPELMASVASDALAGETEWNTAVHVLSLWRSLRLGRLVSLLPNATLMILQDLSLGRTQFDSRQKESADLDKTCSDSSRNICACLEMLMLVLLTKRPKSFRPIRKTRKSRS